MHTHADALFSKLTETTSAVRHRTVWILVPLVLLVLAGGNPTLGQAAFPGAPEEAAVNLRLYPLDTWSPRVGIGVGGGLVLHHIGRSNAQGLLTFAPARHEQVGALVWASANPRRARRYVLVNARGMHTDRDWFYGLGPLSSDDARQATERSSFDVRIRAGRSFLDHRLVIQPHLAVTAHRVDRIPNPSDPRLSPATRTHLRQLSSNDLGPLDPNQTGLRVGLAAEYDTQRGAHTEPGVRLRARWSRYVDVSSSFVRFDEVDLGVYPTVPLTEDHRLTGRFALSLTPSRGRAAVPYYLRPTLDAAVVPGWARHRFVDSDRFVASILYQFPFARLFGVVHVDGHLGVHAANVYDDFFSDAAFDLRFDETLTAPGNSIPLRPSASAGLHLGLPFREIPSLDVAVGVSPEGVTAARFTLRQDLQALRLGPHHSIRRR